MKGTVHTVTIAVLVPARAGTAHDGLAQEGLGEKTGRGSLLKAPLRAPPFPPSPIPDDVIGEKIESKSLPVFIPGLFHLICYQSSSDIK